MPYKLQLFMLKVIQNALPVKTKIFRQLLLLTSVVCYAMALIMKIWIIYCCIVPSLEMFGELFYLLFTPLW